MSDDVKDTILPPHIESTVAAIAKLHAEHHQRATPFQRMTEDLTARAEDFVERYEGHTRQLSLRLV